MLKFEDIYTLVNLVNYASVVLLFFWLHVVFQLIDTAWHDYIRKRY